MNEVQVAFISCKVAIYYCKRMVGMNDVFGLCRVVLSYMNRFVALKKGLINTHKSECLFKELSSLSTDAAGKLDILGHDGDSLGVDGTQVGVFEETDEVGL